jgi:hypothetical protein
MSDKAVGLALPPHEKAPGIRDGIRERASWTLTEIVDGWGTVEPSEGAGVIYPYFRTTKLADAQKAFGADASSALQSNPGWAREDVALRTSPTGTPTDEWAKVLLEWADKVAASDRRAADLAAVSATLTALPPEEVPGYLERQTPLLLTPNPDASLWFFETDRLFPSRMGLLRVLLALDALPDFLESIDEALPKIETLQEHTLTGGARADPLLTPLLLAVPPTTMGFAFSWMPHALVFLFGGAVSLLEPHPPTFASLFVPGLHGSGAGFHWRESDFWEGVGAAEVETLLQWWATRLNVIYSHALDPTNFDNGSGFLDVKAQAVWLLTFERLLADASAIGSSPQSTGLTRVETGFDLLDKAESLLGYSQDKSGKGFMRLLRRNEMIPRLDAIWDSRLPLQLRPRFKVHTRHLYDRVYEHARENAYDFRVATDGTGINVWSENDGKLVKRQWDDYVPLLVRAARNSAHGLIETFNKRSERDIVVTHSGEMAPELPELAAFLAFAIVADAERVCAGTFWD